MDEHGGDMVSRIARVYSLDLIANQVQVPLLAEACVRNEGLPRVAEAYQYVEGKNRRNKAERKKHLETHLEGCEGCTTSAL